MEDFKKVSKEEYKKFIDNYNGKLEWDVTGISEPPIGTHNDFTIGHWPLSVVGKVILNNNQEYFEFKDNEYYILGDDKS